MGQIVGGAAKPKRCNLNKLSQLGTPAAGEYILVSSDNSMNAAGQGNFDCYIVGVGNVAATALPLLKINDDSVIVGLASELNGLNVTQAQNAGTAASYWKNTNNVIDYASSGMGLHRADKISIGEGLKFSLSTTLSSAQVPAALLCDGSGNILQTIARNTSNTSYEGVTPAGTAYIYINYYSTFSLTSEGLVDTISAMSQDVSSLETKVTSLAGEIGEDSYDASYGATALKYWNISDNAVVMANSSAFSALNVIPVDAGKMVKAVIPGMAGMSPKALIFTNDNDEVVEFYSNNWQYGVYRGNVTVPNGATKLYVNFYPSHATITLSIEVIAALNNKVDEMEGEIDELQVSVEDAKLISNYSERQYTSGSIWNVSNNVVALSSSSYTNNSALDAIPVKEGDIAIISTSVQGTPPFVVLANGTSVVKTYPKNSDVSWVVIPAGVDTMYVNRDSAAAFSCSVYAASLYGGVNAMREKTPIPTYAPSPQKPADGSAESDFNAETLTPAELYEAFDALINSMPSPDAPTYLYPKFMSEYSIVGRDASDTYNIYGYVLSRRNRFGWKHANALYAGSAGGSIFYIDSISPRVGDAIYSDANRTAISATISSVDTASQQFTDTGNVVYSKSTENNIQADVVFSKLPQKTTPASLEVYDKNDTLLGTATASGSTALTYGGKSYTRCEDFDFHTDQMGTIVLWGNEHGPWSDPCEPAIVLYRLAKDLSVGCRNNNFLSFLKQYFKIVIIPLVNPYGLVNQRRGNANGVNINRNYNTPGWASQSDTDKGSYGGDQPETQFVMNLTMAVDAVVAIDIHCLSYVTDHTGRTHYAGYIPSTSSRDVLVETMRDYSFDCSSYGGENPDSYAEGQAWIHYVGKQGGLIEMNPGPYATAFDGKQHSAHVLEADYTLMLSSLRMWLHGSNPDIDLSSLCIL
jgi:hypothetical protein